MIGMETPVRLIRSMFVGAAVAAALNAMAHSAWAQGELYFNPDRSLIWDAKAEQDKADAEALKVKRTKEAAAFVIERANETPYVTLRDIFGYLAQKVTTKFSVEEFEKGALQGIAKKSKRWRSERGVEYQFKYGTKTLNGNSFFGEYLNDKEKHINIYVSGYLEREMESCLRFGEAREFIVEAGWVRETAASGAISIDKYHKDKVTLLLENIWFPTQGLIHRYTKDGGLELDASLQIEERRKREAIEADSLEFKATCVHSIVVFYTKG